MRSAAEADDRSRLEETTLPASDLVREDALRGLLSVWADLAVRRESTGPCHCQRQKVVHDRSSRRCCCPGQRPLRLGLKCVVVSFSLYPAHSWAGPQRRFLAHTSWPQNGSRCRGSTANFFGTPKRSVALCISGQQPPYLTSDSC